MNRGTMGAVPTFGVQLYTVRGPLAEDPADTLRKIARIGYTDIEAFHDDVSALAPLARACGLRLISTHVSADLVAGTGAASREAHRDTLRSSFDAMRAQGVDYVGTYMPYAACEHTPAFWLDIGDRLNDAGRIAREAGLTFVYHNHAVELSRLPDGQFPLDVLLQAWDPALVGLELDVFWASIAGGDPVSLMERLGRRVVLLHLKDKAADAPVTADDRTVAPAAFMEIGAGVLPMTAILRAADACGVRHVFVEQDHTPGDPLVSLERSFSYVQVSA